MLLALVILGVVVLVSAAASFVIARELHAVSAAYPPAPTVIHCPGRCDAEIVERFIACCDEHARRERELATQMRFDL